MLCSLAKVRAEGMTLKTPQSLNGAATPKWLWPNFLHMALLFTFSPGEMLETGPSPWLTLEGSGSERFVGQQIK